VKRLEKVRKVVTSVLVAGMVAAFSFAVSNVLTHHHSNKFVLADTVGFHITSAVYAAPVGTYPASTCTGANADLYPGETDCLLYTVHNKLSVPITVKTIAATATGFTPSGKCNPSTVTVAPFSGNLTVTAGGTATVGEPITMKTSGSSQNTCENGTFLFSYTGSADFSDTSQTTLSSAPNPSTAGQTVTFTATVKGKNPKYDTSMPTGTVTFYKCASTHSCTTTSPLGSAAVTSSTGKATLTTSSLYVGTDYVQAIYSAPVGTTDFSSSRSNIVAQVVQATPCITAKINGGYVVKPGQHVSICTTVNGGVTVDPGGALTLQGATINGGVNSTGARTLYGQTALQFCGSTINGGATLNKSTGFVYVGDAKPHDDNPTCTGDTISGGLKITNGKGGFEVGGNKVSGGITLTNNTGTGGTEAKTEVEANAVTGGLTCSGNSTGFTNDAKPNSVTGKRSGQCLSGSF